jgi:hypothetical protein
MKTRLIIVLLILILTNAKAQVLGISPVKIWTNNYEIENPIGIGVSVAKTIWFITLKGEYIFARSNRTYSGYMSSGFLVVPMPPIENISSTSSYSAYEFSLSFAFLSRKSNVDMNIGFGYSFDSYVADRVGSTTGKKANFESGIKNGPFVSFSGDYYIVNAVRIGLCYKIKGLSLGSMATDIELPFANIKTVRELQLSLFYSLNSMHSS